MLNLLLFDIIAVGIAFSRLAEATPLTEPDRRTAEAMTDIPQLPYYLYPTVVSQYNTNTGAVTYNTGRGKIYKTPADPNAITTLITYELPEWLSDLNCTNRFALNSASNTIVAGTRQIDLFRSLNAPSPGEQYNGRDWNFGRWQLSSSSPAGEASVLYTTKGEWLPCPPGGLVLGVELVGVGDQDDIEWDEKAGVNGPYVVIDRLT